MQLPRKMPIGLPTDVIIIQHCGIIPSNMGRPAGERSEQVVMGEFFVQAFYSNEGATFTPKEIGQIATELGVASFRKNLSSKIKRYFGGAINFEQGKFGIEPGWFLEDFLDLINLNRIEKGFEPLKEPDKGKISVERG